jgi:hypothetical protein
MLIFFTFMPIRIIVGGMLGGVGLGLIAAREDAGTAPQDRTLP